MNVQHLIMAAAPLLCARILRDRTTVHANLDIPVMDALAKVYSIHFKGFLLLNQKEEYLKKLPFLDRMDTICYD